MDQESVGFLRRAVDSQSGHILIHCKHGQSRSATVLAAFMLHVARQAGTPKTAQEVLAELKACRPRVSPNLGFLRQLDDFAEAKCGVLCPSSSQEPQARPTPSV